MNFSRALVLGGTLVLTTTIGGAQQATPALVDPSHLRMQPEAAEAAFGKEVQVAVFGDPAKPGLYAIRRKFKPGEMSRPHYHDMERLVTVIKGTWFTGEGDIYDPSKTVAVKTGGFMLHPAGLHHYDGAKDEEVIVQIIGMGPVMTVNTEKK
jgi:quercetin dioxygenase-like cupin family protein